MTLEEMTIDDLLILHKKEFELFCKGNCVSTDNRLFEI